MKSKVFISGIGWMMGQKKDADRNCVFIEKEQYEYIISNINHKSIDRISKICLATAKMALVDSKTEQNSIEEECSLFLGTMYGPLNSIHEFDSVSVNKGALYVNPGLFPNTVLNSPACQTGIHYKLSKPIYTISNGITSALDAVGLGYLHIAGNLCPAALTGGVDEIPNIQMASKRFDKLLIESCGFIVLQNKKPTDRWRRFVEVIGYDSFVNANEISEKVCNEITKRLSGILKHEGAEIFQIKELRIYSSLPKDCLKQICIKIWEDCGIGVRSINTSVDLMGAGSLFQIYCSYLENTQRCYIEDKQDDFIPTCGRTGLKSLMVMLSIDESKISMLVLKMDPVSVE